MLTSVRERLYGAGAIVLSKAADTEEDRESSNVTGGGVAAPRDF